MAAETLNPSRLRKSCDLAAIGSNFESLTDYDDPALPLRRGGGEVPAAGAIHHLVLVKLPIHSGWPSNDNCILLLTEWTEAAGDASAGVRHAPGNKFHNRVGRRPV
jgi:hypothetical protein